MQTSLSHESSNLIHIAIRFKVLKRWGTKLRVPSDWAKHDCQIRLRFAVTGWDWHLDPNQHVRKHAASNFIFNQHQRQIVGRIMRPLIGFLTEDIIEGFFPMSPWVCLTKSHTRLCSDAACPWQTTPIEAHPADSSTGLELLQKKYSPLLQPIFREIDWPEWFLANVEIERAKEWLQSKKLER